MISNYQGHYSFDYFSISENSPNNIGVYYCGALHANGNLNPYYIGRAKGEFTSIRSRLLEHFNSKKWQDVIYFGYVLCTTVKEAEELEEKEIARFNPKYNVIGTTDIYHSFVEALLNNKNLYRRM